jgi:Tfp pilus assembly protein PilZ
MSRKRTHRRYGPLVIKTFLTLGAARKEAYLTNLSEGGAFLAIDDPPELAARVEMRAMLPWRLGELRAFGRVVWRSDTAKGAARLSGVGVAFEELDPQATRLLHAYLDRFTELATRIGELPEEPIP